MARAELAQGELMMSEFVEFLAEEPEIAAAEDKSPWIIGVIDDEPAVFEATRIALEDSRFEGRPIRLVYADSALQGRQLLAGTPDMACVLLDVVMETEQAGLDLVRFIREGMNNQAIRIILRTGQPGYAPPMDVIRRYDINDYKEKSELTQTRLWTAVACALRSYQQIMALEMNRRGLRMIIEASSDLMQRRGIDDFACGVVTQLAAHLGLTPDGLVCVRQSAGSGEAIVVGAAGKFAGAIHQPLVCIEDPQAVDIINRALNEQGEVAGGDDMALFISGGDWTGAIYVKGRTDLCALDRELLRLYCHNVSLGFENVRLFETVSEAAFTDRVTLLPTRISLEQTLADMMETSRRLGVLVVDVDRFAHYNTLLGGEFSKDLLRALAKRLVAVLPERQRVGCLFGDVFALLLDGTQIDRPQSLIARIGQPLQVGERELLVGLSYGFARLPDGERLSAQQLIHRAEVALHEAKQGNPAILVNFSPEIEAAQRSRVLLAHDLREAIEAGTVYLEYQPQVHIGSGRSVAAEALMRWKHDSLGQVPPDHFITVAEASGLIADLGRWVARRACRDMRPILAAGLLDRVTINLSPVQLRDPACLADLHAVVIGEGLVPTQVEWEITESAVLDSDTAVDQIRWASGLGYTIALDDFGTGHSSLSMLRTIPLHVVKIDRSFLLEVSSDPRARAILRSIADVCGNLGLATTAEGVETDDQLRALQSAEIGNAQGFLFSRPLAPASLHRWLGQRAR